MNIIWIIIAALLGFSIAAIFAGLLKLPRNIFLIIYIPLVFALFTIFAIHNKISLRELIFLNWYWGLLGAILTGIFVIKNVLSQPSSERSKGTGLLIDITWPGLLYGLSDALLLSVLPVLATNLAFSETSWNNVWYGKIGIGLAALIAGFFVTTAYHIGYPEFRGKKVVWPNVGNGVLTLAYILTLNPLSAILPHMGMHVAAMIHGRETTGQVPPHYPEPDK